MVVSELRGEKIDIIPYNDEPARFVAKALSPARVREVLVDDDGRQATVIVPDDQLSLAIGREGQNARLAARLTGWRVDIKSETEFSAEEAEHGYEEEDVGGRCAAILANGRRCPNAALPSSRYCGLDSHQALAQQEGDHVGAPGVGEEADAQAETAMDTVEESEAAPTEAAAEPAETVESVQAPPTEPVAEPPADGDGDGAGAPTEAPAAEAGEGAPS
jgi:N utilization substance protein A